METHLWISVDSSSHYNGLEGNQGSFVPEKTLEHISKDTFSTALNPTDYCRSPGKNDMAGLLKRPVWGHTAVAGAFARKWGEESVREQDAAGWWLKTADTSISLVIIHYCVYAELTI